MKVISRLLNRRFLPTLMLGAAFTAQAAQGPTGENHGVDVVSYMLGLIVILLAAKLGGELFERLRQPAVLGELVVGVILGNLSLVGFTSLEVLKTNQFLATTAEVGVILLLFEVGLESHIHDLMAVGLSALVVAAVGVIVPSALGYFVAAYFLPESPWYVHLFAGTTLAATSVGITARVLRDLGKTETREARIILGAAVVDDVMGLVVLAVVSGIVGSIAHGGRATFEWGQVAIIAVKAALFLAGAIFIGRHIHVNALKFGTRFRVPGIPLVFAICYCFALASLAGSIGLAPIVGAFAAGIVLEGSDYEEFLKRGEMPIENLIRPLSTLFVPVFFVLMGLRVDLQVFSSATVLIFAAALTVAAVLGKQACALGVVDRGVHRLTVGVGMIPRGEVGLIFTGIGANLFITGKPVFNSDTVSAMVVMVMATTVITPPLLKLVFPREQSEAPSGVLVAEPD